MKLGEMLVRDGRVNQEQLDQALDRQAREGGRLGTVLVEMGLLDTDALTVYLGLELGIPIATTAALGRAKATAVRLLTPEQARRYRCVPILIQDRQLIAAVDDPLDWESLDELSRTTGYRLVPRVAPETRIFYYLERYYGISRPPRLAQLGEPDKPQQRRPDLPAPPLPGLPPHSEAPVPAPTPPKPLRAIRADSETGHSRSSDYEALELDAADLVEELDTDAEEGAENARLGEPPRESASSASAEAVDTAGSGPPSALARNEAETRMAEAESREEVADALLGYALSHFDGALLFMVRDNMAFGWKGAGEIETERLDAMLLPLEAPSMFQVAIYNQGLFRGRPFPATLHNYLYRVLRIEPPPYAAVAASFIGPRPVNLLYGHVDGGEPLSDDALEALGEVSRSASEAYVRLIAASKRARS